jgi:hypothetical protein
MFVMVVVEDAYFRKYIVVGRDRVGCDCFKHYIGLLLLTVDFFMNSFD